MAHRVVLLDHVLLNIFGLRCSRHVTCAAVSARGAFDNRMSRGYSTEVSEIEEGDVESTEEEDRLRDVSRLPRTLRNRMGDVLKPPTHGVDRDSDRWKFFARSKFVRHQRKLFAKYGHDSGVDPGVMWPSKEELKEIIEFERETEPTLQQLWEQMKTEQENKEKQIMEREKVIEENLAKMPALLEAYRKHLQERGQEKLAIQMKQKQLLDEARDYYGYKLHKHDPRLKELKQKKMEQERLARRQKSREEKEKANLARAEARAAELRAKMQAKESASKVDEDETDEEEDETGK